MPKTLAAVRTALRDAGNPEDAIFLQRFSRRDQVNTAKATCFSAGWMLREVGKRDEPVLARFLDAHATTMPRTALRYAIERMTPERREHDMAR